MYDAWDDQGEIDLLVCMGRYIDVAVVEALSGLSERCLCFCTSRCRLVMFEG